MGKRAELTGRRFGMLVAISPAHLDDAHQWHWNVHCDCGNQQKTVRAHDLLTGKQTSCGCVHVTHGATKGGKPTPEYLSWRGMLARCTNPKATGFENYGGRGVTVCERWQSFALFLEDMGPRPNITDSIDRIDNDGNYEPGNCRWATTLEQNQKKRSLVMLTVDGETSYLADWARRVGLDEDTLRKRVLKLGWDHRRAVMTPTRGSKVPLAS